MADQPPRRFRRLRRMVLAGFVLLLLAGAALWAFLPAIVERIVADHLVAMGAPAPRLNMREIGLDQAIVGDFGLGTAGEFAAREIVVSYRLADLLDGRVDGVTIRGATLRAVIGADGLSLGSLDPLLAGSGGATPDIPPIDIEDATLTLVTAFGDVAVAADGRIAARDGTIAAALTFDAAAPQGAAGGKLELRMAGDEIDADVVLSSARLSLPDLGHTSGSGRLNVRVVDGAPQRLDGHLDIAALAASDPLLAPLGDLSGSLDLVGGSGGWRLTGHAADARHSFAADLRLYATTAELEAPTTLALDLAARADAPLWRMARLPEPSAGSATLSLVSRFTPSKLLAFAGDGGMLPAFDGSIALALDGLALPGTVDALSAAGGLDMRAADGVLQVSAPAPLLVELTPAPERLAAAGLPAELVALLDRPLSVSLMLPDPIRLEPRDGGHDIAGGAELAVALGNGTRLLDIAATCQAFISGSGAISYELPTLDIALVLPEGTALPPGRVEMIGRAAGRAGSQGQEAEAEMMLLAEAPRATAAGLDARNLSMRLPLTLTYAEQHLAVRLDAPGTIAMERLSGPTPFTLDGPLRLPLAAGEAPALTVDLDAAGAPSATLDLAAGPLDLAGSLATEGGEIAGNAKLPKLHLSGDGSLAAWSARLSASGASLALPAYGVEATGVDLEIALPAGQGPQISVNAGIAHRGTPAYVIPLSASIRARQVRNGWAFSGSVKDAFGRISLALDGRHDLARGTGSATLKLAPIELVPNVRQPADLMPWLKGLAQDVSGTVALAGDISWTSEVVGSKLELLLRDLSATTTVATVERINGVIAIDGLAPPSTPPGQQVAVALIDAGLPLTDGLLSFRVAPGPSLEISGGRLHLAGGAVQVEPLVYDPAAASNQAVLVVEGVDLGELLALAGVDGLTGQGRLSGRVPVVVTADQVIISGGVLEAEAPGSLSYAPLTPPAALQGQGETVSLAMSALTNFQYQALRLTVDRQAGGEMTVAMHVRGNNPDFYDGYPVEFNLNVTGALDRVLRQSLAGYRIPAAIEERLQEFGR